MRPTIKWVFIGLNPSPGLRDVKSSGWITVPKAMNLAALILRRATERVFISEG